MSFGCATRADIPALRRLWMDCFGDTKDYVNLYMEHAFDPERVFVLREEEIAAMLISFPVSHIGEDGGERRGAYLYAVCTAPAQRGRGLCRRLMEQTEQALAARGDTFTCLRAADEQLSAMYGRMGYAETFTNREFTVERAGESDACPRKADCLPCTGDTAEASNDRPVDVEQVSPAAYYALRQWQLRGDFVDYAPELLAHQGRLGALLSVGGGAAIAAVERYGAAAICKEFLGDETLLPALQKQLGADKLLVRTPGGTPFAMAKSLTDAPAPGGYLAFAFD